MSTKPAEILLFDFLADRVAATSLGDVLYQIIVHDTVYQSVNKADRLLRISDAVSSVSPGPGMAMKEWDVQVVIAAAVRVVGSDKTERQTALTDLFAIQSAVYDLLFGDGTLGGRVCDIKVERGPRGYDVLDSEPYAVAHIPLIINPSGARITGAV